MSNVQFYILLCATFGGVLWTRAEVHQLSGHIDRLGEQLSARIDRIEADLRQFYQILGRHEKAIEILEKRS